MNLAFPKLNIMESSPSLISVEFDKCFVKSSASQRLTFFKFPSCVVRFDPLMISFGCCLSPTYAYPVTENMQRRGLFPDRNDI